MTSPYTLELSRDADAQMSYLQILDRTKHKIHRTIELDNSEGLLADIDIDGNIIGIEIYGFIENIRTSGPSDGYMIEINDTHTGE